MKAIMSMLVLMISFFIDFPIAGYPNIFLTQVVKAATLNPQQDLSVTFTSKPNVPEPGYIVGGVKNKSDNVYPCVDLKFHLSTRFDTRHLEEKERHLGFLSTRVKNIQPHSTMGYEVKLPYAAGFALESIDVCQEEPLLQQGEIKAEAASILSFTVDSPRIKEGETSMLRWRIAGDPEHIWISRDRKISDKVRVTDAVGQMRITPDKTASYQLHIKDRAGKDMIREIEIQVSPKTPGTCSISGLLSGKLRWKVKDDRGNLLTFKVENVFMKATDEARPMRTLVHDRSYRFSNVPAGKAYEVFPGNFRAQPRKRIVTCEQDKKHINTNFKIIGPPLYE